MKAFFQGELFFDKSTFSVKKIQWNISNLFYLYDQWFFIDI